MTTTSNANNSPLQNCGKLCLTAQRKITFIALVYTLTVLVCIGAVAFTCYAFQPTILEHPDFEPNAVVGAPMVDKSLGFSTLTVRDDYAIQICGSPAFDGQNVHLYLTNPKGNNVWFRAEILSEDGEVLGSTGVLKQGQYIECVQLYDEIKEDTTTVMVRIVGYVPNTWHSAGNVNLQIVLRCS